MMQFGGSRPTMGVPTQRSADMVQAHGEDRIEEQPVGIEVWL